MRHAGGGYVNLTRAAGNQLDSTGLRLWQLNAETDRHVHEGGAEGVAVYGRGYAAVALLAERYGYPATVQLLRDNRDGSLEHFQELLTALTGMDLARLDESVGDWLVAPGRVVF